MISIRFEASDLTGIRTALRAFLSDTRDEAQTPQVNLAAQVATLGADSLLPPEPPKRTRRTKAEMEAARAAEAADADGDGAAVQAAQATAEATPAPAAEAPPPPPSTFADAKAALTRIVQTDGLGVPGGTELLKAAGVARLTQLTEEQWPAFVAACEAKLKAHAA